MWYKPRSTLATLVMRFARRGLTNTHESPPKRGHDPRRPGACDLGLKRQSKGDDDEDEAARALHPEKRLARY